jgi:hypothetical protein
MDSFAFRSGTDARHPYFVLLHTAAAPDVTTWHQYVEALADKITRARTAVHIFAVTDGGGPEAPQRRALAAAFAPDQFGAMTHVFTTSSVTRGIVTAFHWLARARAVAHLPQEFPAVCARCQLSVLEVLEDLLSLQAALPAVALLSEIEQIVRGASGRSGPLRNK